MKSDNWEELIRSDLLPYNVCIPLHSIKYSNEYVKGPKYKKLLLYVKDNVSRYYENFADHFEVGEYCLELFLEKKDFLKKYVKFWKDEYKKLDLLINEIRAVNLENISDIKLAKLLTKIYKQAIYWHGIAYNVDAIDATLNPKIEELIKKSYPEERKSKLSNAYNKLTFPPVLSYINRMLLDKLKLIIEVKKHGKEKCEKKIDKFINDYYWIDFKWGESEEYTKEQFLEEAKKIRNTKENYNNETKRFKEEIKAKKSYLKEIEGKFPIIKKYLEIFDEYAVLHDLRKEGQVKVVYCIREIYKIIAKRNNVDCNKLYFLWPAELVESIKKKKFDKTLMTKRSKEWYCVHYKNGYSEEYFGEEALKKRDEAIKINKEDYNKELLGMSASQGRIIGTARVCFSADEAMKKVKKGDILVTGMTMPEFVPVMKKAAAIVTDEGGLTCHAAIISRELGKPCVVGTKMATRIIKDGDLIEVNANHGIIKIIK